MWFDVGCINPGVDLLGNLPGCVCQKVREMGSFSA